ncbi:reverse transcriptase domain-containing protein [Tanacetum coccineum]
MKSPLFYQKTNETFNEAWERFKGLLRQCPHHGFSKLHQLDTFYNSLNTNDQDALDSAAGGNFLDKMPRDGLAIIESKSKVRYSRSRAIEPRFPRSSKTGKFLIPCALQELDRTSALADSGASINLLPHSIYKQLWLGALTPTLYTRACQSFHYSPNGHSRGSDPFSGRTTNILPPSSSLMKTSDNFEKFADELAPLDSLPPENDKDVEIKSFSSFTLTSPEESEFEAYLERDSIPPGIDLTLPPNP